MKGCDITCKLSIGSTIVSIIVVATVAIACVLYRREKRARSAKQVGSLLSLGAVPSDYVDERERHLATNGIGVSLDSALWSRELRAINQVTCAWIYIILNTHLYTGPFKHANAHAHTCTHQRTHRQTNKRTTRASE